MVADYSRPFQISLVEQASIAIPEIALTGISKGILLIGGSGVGKTHAFDMLARLFPPQMDGPMQLIPAIRLSLNTKANASSIAKDALAQLGRPISSRERHRLDDLERMLLSAMQARGTKLFMLEEFHNGLLAGSAAIRTENRHFLKNLWNQHDPRNPTSWVSTSAGSKPNGLLLVVSATDELLKPLAKDPELKSRFGTVIQAPNLGLFPRPLYDEFRSVLQSMLERYELISLVSANDHQFSAMMFFATRAHLRVMNDIVQRTATLKKRKGAICDDSIYDVFAEAYSQVGGEAFAGEGNPFRWTEQETVSRVKQAQLKLASTPR